MVGAGVTPRGSVQGSTDEARQAAQEAREANEIEEDEERRRQWEEEDAEERAAWGASTRPHEVLQAEPELSKEEELALLEKQYEQALKQVCSL